jgi:O-antigen ligase
LQDEEGERLIRNGDFSAGGDYWFFKTHSHLPWHIKNLWVEVLFEQGWFGLISFLLLLAAVVGHLAPAVWRGDRLAGVLLASTGGFLTVGLFGSLFDTPRIATLFFLLVVLAGTAVPRGGNRFPGKPIGTN